MSDAPLTGRFWFGVFHFINFGSETSFGLLAPSAGDWWGVSRAHVPRFSFNQETHQKGRAPQLDCPQHNSTARMPLRADLAQWSWPIGPKPKLTWAVLNVVGGNRHTTAVLKGDRQGGPACFLGNLRSRLAGRNLHVRAAPNTTESASSRPGNHASGLRYEIACL